MQNKVEEFINSTEKREYFKNLDFFRFVFACIVVACHFYAYLYSLEGADTIFKFILKNKDNLWWPVELFFVLTGFCFIYNFKPKQSWTDFIKIKLIRFWPIMMFTVLFAVVLSIFKVVHLYFFDDVFALLFMNGQDIANRVHSHYDGMGNIYSTWFLAGMMYAVIVYRYVILNYGFKLFNLLLILLIPMGMHIQARCIPVVYHVFIIRAFYAIGIGVLVAYFYIYQKENLKALRKKLTSKHKFFLTLAELGIFCYMIFGILFSHMDNLYEPDIILMFVVLFILFLFRGGGLSNLLENSFSVLLGKYSLSIFVVHCVFCEIFQKYYFVNDVWKSFSKLNLCFKEEIYYLIPIVFSIFMGIVIYHLYEFPMQRYLKKRFMGKK